MLILNSMKSTRWKKNLLNKIMKETLKRKKIVELKKKLVKKQVETTKEELKQKEANTKRFSTFVF